MGKRQEEKGKEEKWNEKRGLQGSGEEAGAAGDVRPFSLSLEKEWTMVAGHSF